MFWGGGYKFNIHPQMYPFKNTAFKNRIMDDLYAGRIFGRDGALAHTVEGIRKMGTDENGNISWDNVISNLKEAFGETLGAIGELINNIGNTFFGNSFNLGEIFDKTADKVAREGAKEQGKEKWKALQANLNSMWKT